MAASLDVGDVVHLVGEDGGDGRLALEVDLDDDDACVGVGRWPVHAEHHPQVGEGHDAAAHVDEAADEGPGVRHFGDRHDVENLAHAAGLDGEDLVLEPQRQHLHGRPLWRCALMRPSPCCCRPEAVLELPGRSSPGGSGRGSGRRCRRRGSSPPRRCSMSACSLESDLMTVWLLPMIWSTTSPTRNLARGDDHHLLVRVGRVGRAEQLPQPQERHQRAADVEEVAALGLRSRRMRQFDAFLDRRERDRVAAAADPDQHAVDDGEGQRQAQRRRCAERRAGSPGRCCRAGCRWCA
jgi:hypothetical protein